MADPDKLADIANCPFCGSDKIHWVETPDSSKASGFMTWIECGRCGGRGPERSTRGDAHRKWTSRAYKGRPPDKLTDIIERASQALAKIDAVGIDAIAGAMNEVDRDFASTLLSACVAITSARAILAKAEDI